MCPSLYSTWTYQGGICKRQAEQTGSSEHERTTDTGSQVLPSSLRSFKTQIHRLACIRCTSDSFMKEKWCTGVRSTFLSAWQEEGSAALHQISQHPKERTRRRCFENGSYDGMESQQSMENPNVPANSSIPSSASLQEHNFVITFMFSTQQTLWSKVDVPPHANRPLSAVCKNVKRDNLLQAKGNFTCCWNPCCCEWILNSRRKFALIYPLDVSVTPRCYITAESNKLAPANRQRLWKLGQKTLTHFSPRKDMFQNDLFCPIFHMLLLLQLWNNYLSRSQVKAWKKRVWQQQTNLASACETTWCSVHWTRIFFPVNTRKSPPRLRDPLGCLHKHSCLQPTRSPRY